MVGINSSDYIRRVKKYEPLPDKERVKELMELGFISRVIVFKEPDPREFIKRVYPDVHCISEEYGTNCVEYPVCQEMDIRVVFIPRIGNWSTRAILKESENAGNIQGISPTKT